GAWALNKMEDIKFIMDESILALTENNLVDLAKPNTLLVELSVKDEYDMNKLCGHIEEHNRIMIRAEYGGCGKSYTCKSMESKGHKVLFVCPTNRLARNYKDHGCTLNKIFGIGHTEGDNRAKV
ncbi:MAG: hypothetical protein ACKPKO_06080, partial [Candidatus Fonsibacter sp.]